MFFSRGFITSRVWRIVYTREDFRELPTHETGVKCLPSLPVFSFIGITVVRRLILSFYRTKDESPHSTLKSL